MTIAVTRPASGPIRQAAPIEVRPDGVVPLRRPGPDPFRVLLFGGGALVGWGLLDHERGLPGRIADRLARRGGQGVDLDVIVEADPTRPEALAGLRGLRVSRYDAIVVLLGERAGLEHVGRSAWAQEFEALARTLNAESAKSAPLLVFDSAKPMVAVSSTGLKRMRATAGAARLADVSRSLCDGGRIAFEELEAPGNLLGWGRQFATANYREWGEQIADRLLPSLQLAVRRTGPDTPASVRERAQEERVRQRAVDSMRLSAAVRDGLLDGIARQARVVYRAGTAFVSIVDGDRVWQRASTESTLGELPRARAFCNWTVQRDSATVVSDARVDRRFADALPSLGGRPAVFYAGEPIHAMDGHRIGALCIADSAPRSLAPAQLSELHVLAGRVEQELWAQTLLRRH